jgi:hydroxyacylglutathione hydrolase
MSGLSLECITVGPLQANAWLLLDSDTGEAALVDPGEEPRLLLSHLARCDCRLRWLLATHGHFDHVGAAAAIQQELDVPLLVHPGDIPLIESMPAQQAAFGLPPSNVPRLEDTLTDGRVLELGSHSLEVVAVAGHSPGHVMMTWPGHALVGDCIFAGSVGRTDLPGGDFDTLAKSIRERIYTMPPPTVLHPGHGPDTTVETEMRSNPFVSMN